MLACSGRFDGGIECEQVGLFGDTDNYFQYLGDTPVLVRKAFHLPSSGVQPFTHIADGGNGLIHLLSAANCGTVRATSRVGGLHRVLCDSCYGGGHLRAGRVHHIEFRCFALQFLLSLFTGIQ